jgi:hypothetical protein
MSRIDNPTPFQLLHGSGAPRAGSGLDPLNGVNNPWRWSGSLLAWITPPYDVSWGSGATIASFAAPVAGDLMLAVGIDGDNPTDLTAAQAAGGFAYVELDGTRNASDTFTVSTAGTGTAFLAWSFTTESTLSGSTYTATRTEVLPTETRTVAGLLGADFTVSGAGVWSEETVGHPGDYYIDTTSPTLNLYGPRVQDTWGGTPVARLSGLVSPGGIAYQVVVADDGTLSAEPL